MGWIFMILLFLCACSPNSSREFLREGEAKCLEFIRDLEKIETRDQLLSMRPQIEAHFESLITLMIQARQFQEKHPDEEAEIAAEESRVSIQLEEELRRIYRIEGGREIIEKSQHEALVRLDAYERSLEKRRQQPVL